MKKRRCFDPHLISFVDLGTAASVTFALLFLLSQIQKHSRFFHRIFLGAGLSAIPFAILNRWFNNAVRRYCLPVC